MKSTLICWKDLGLDWEGWEGVVWFCDCEMFLDCFWEANKIHSVLTHMISLSSPPPPLVDVFDILDILPQASEVLNFLARGLFFG
jgi:hypothetical protein